MSNEKSSEDKVSDPIKRGSEIASQLDKEDTQMQSKWAQMQTPEALQLAHNKLVAELQLCNSVKNNAGLYRNLFTEEERKLIRKIIDYEYECLGFQYLNYPDDFTAAEHINLGDELVTILPDWFLNREDLEIGITESIERPNEPLLVLLKDEEVVTYLYSVGGAWTGVVLTLDGDKFIRPCPGSICRDLEESEEALIGIFNKATKAIKFINQHSGWPSGCVYTESRSGMTGIMLPGYVYETEKPNQPEH